MTKATFLAFLAFLPLSAFAQYGQPVINESMPYPAIAHSSSSKNLFMYLQDNNGQTTANLQELDAYGVPTADQFTSVITTPGKLFRNVALKVLPDSGLFYEYWDLSATATNLMYMYRNPITKRWSSPQPGIAITGEVFAVESASPLADGRVLQLVTFGANGDMGMVTDDVHVEKLVDGSDYDQTEAVGLAVSPDETEAYAGWSGAGNDSTFHVQKIYPTRGPIFTVPQSHKTGDPNASGLGRMRLFYFAGNVYTVYFASNYKKHLDELRIWQVGARASTLLTSWVVKGAYYIGRNTSLSTTISADYRVWLSWSFYNPADGWIWEGYTGRLNPALSGISTPRKTLVTPGQEINNGPLFPAGATGVTAFGYSWYAGDNNTELHNYVAGAPVTLAMTTKSVKAKKTQKITFKVSDVGVPVAGAVVSGFGTSATTNAAGIAQLVATPQKGKAVVTVTTNDYQAGSLIVTVK